jgi:eukaryotic-like serine/threonine-protein kinase
MRAGTKPGRLVAGRYRLLGPIGRGAMGVVWRGRDELLRRDVAVKEVLIAAGAPGDLAGGDAAGYERTLREARAAAQLSHPGVVTVFDILEEDGRPWIVMELVAGRSLDQVIAEDGPLPPAQAARLGAGLVSALAAAHAAGVLHRDVKPANVLVTADGRAVLTDFGIAKIGADAGLTQTGMVVGTPGFTAPERIRGEPATPASDLWSLGATLYAAVEGRGPFERPGGMAAVCAGVVREEPPRAPSAGGLGPVIAALLSRDPASRPEAARAEDLLSAAAGEADETSVAGLAALAETVGVAGGAHADSTLALGGRGGAGAGFLDPPAFGDLVMPGPVPPPGPAGAGGYSLPAFLDGGGAGAGAPGTARPAWPAQPPRSGDGAARRGYWRLAAVGGGIGAIVVAAIIGLGWYTHSLNAGDSGTDTAGGRPGGAASSPAGPARRPSVTPSAVAAGGGPGTPPAGFTWQTVTAASQGAAAGFVMAVPDGWSAQAGANQTVAYVAPSGLARIDVTLAPFTAATPVRQAELDQAGALLTGTFPGYRLDAITPASFRGAAAADWRFTWRPELLLRATTSGVLVTLPTSAGPQPYTISVTAPSAGFAAYRDIFDTALGTFATLPG